MTIENISADDIAAVPNSNLRNSDDFIATTRDVTAEERAKGHFKEGSTSIPEHAFNNNLDVVIRDGVRVHSGGELRPNDIVKINGVEMEYEMAQSIGAISDGQFTSPQESFQQDVENAPEAEPVDDRPEEAKLLSDQFELAFGQNGGEVLNMIGQNIVENGELSEDGIEFLDKKMGVSEQRYQEAYNEMQEVGGQVIQNFLNMGDGLEGERIEFLVNLAENGTRDQQAIVRNVWFKAATGQLSRDSVIDAFNYLYEPYA